MFTAGLWLAATVTSTAMVWAATSIVAADVTDRPPSAIAHADVVSELASGPSVVTTAPPVTVPTGTGSTTTVPVGGRSGATTGPTTTVRAQTPQPTVTIAASSPPATTATTAPAALPATRPAGPTTTVRPSATYSTTGGVVRVACNGFFIDLVSAIPNNGYSVKVVVSGPVNVEVHFVRSGQDVSVKAVCFSQPIRYYDQTPPRSGSGPFGAATPFG